MNHPCVLIIDDDAVDRKIVLTLLAQARFTGTILQADSRQAAHQMLCEHAVDCVLLDYNLPGVDGLEFLSALLNTPDTIAPIIMLTGEGNELIAVDAMKRGAADYIPKNLLSTEHLLHVIQTALEKHQLRQQLIAAQTLLAHQAKYDQLTGLGNRNLFLSDLDLITAGCAKRAEVCFVLMMDLNKFKAVNDNYGHDAGNTVLQTVGQRLSLLSRNSDLYYRLGGDEFTAILTLSDLDQVQQIAQRISQELAKPIAHGEMQLEIGVSIGIAAYPLHGNDGAQLLRVADAAMYQAKRSSSRIQVADDAR